VAVCGRGRILPPANKEEIIIKINKCQQVREDESLEIRHTARNAVSRERTSTNQFEITIKDEGRF
jgi:hypothetical protein